MALSAQTYELHWETITELAQMVHRGKGAIHAISFSRERWMCCLLSAFKLHVLDLLKSQYVCLSNGTACIFADGRPQKMQQ